jgi:hypothetical protein
MSKTKLTITILIIISIAFGVLAGFYFYTQKSTPPVKPTPTDKTIFGGIGGVRTDLPTDNTNNVPPENGNINDQPQATTTPKINPLRMITSSPISGAAFVIRDIVATTSSSSIQLQQNISTSTNSTSTKPTTKTVSSKKTTVIKPKILAQEENIRYIEKGTGRVYEAKSSTTVVERITNSTHTRITEAFFDKKGENILLRGLLGNSDNIQTRLGATIFESPTSTSMSLITKDLPYNLLSVSLSPERDSFAYYVEQKGVGSSVNIGRLDGTGVINLYKSPFREWLLSWPNKDMLVLNTKPSFYSEGFAYSINTKTKSFKRITGGQPGLTTLVSPDGQNVLIGESIDGSTKLSVLNIKTNSIKDIFIRTLPEKCTWSLLEKNTIFCAASESIVYAPYPDAWYQGLVFFNDNIWKINLDTLENKLLCVVKDTVKDGVDVTNISLNKNEDYLIFTNKKDLSLWGLQIEKPQKATSTATSTKSTKASSNTKTSVKNGTSTNSTSTTTAK